jgi:hypothetical protein
MRKLMPIIFLHVFCYTQAYAQQSVMDSISYVNCIKRFEKLIVKNYKPDHRQVKSLCENSCIFIRFKILKGGIINDLAFSNHTIGYTKLKKNTPAFITEALTNAFKSAEIQGALFKDLQSDTRTYLLPFIYYYTTGCDAMRRQEKQKLDMLDTTYKPVNAEYQGNAILNMLNFTGKVSDNINYTILNPIEVGAVDRKLVAN